MLLKNLMEDKQLNFDQPFLSVRRHSPTVTSQKRDINRRIDSYSYQVRPQIPTYRSELKSGPIRNPGAVPFLWEHSPGQPKEEMKPQARNSDKPPIAPMLPPGRYQKAKQQDSHSVNVPFTSENKEPDVGVSCDSHTAPSNDENVRNIESSKDAAKEEEGSESGESDEAYVDALSTLSRTDNSFLNCSVSGLSGVEDLDVKASEKFSRDSQTHEFMMDRFLPAAKAMASETPHAPKKQPVQLQMKQPKKTANQSKPSLRYGPSFAKKYSHYHESGEEEEESDDEYDQRANMPSVCGLLPRFCLKSSLCLLSSVSAMSVRTRVPTSSASKVRSRSSSSGSYTEMENESRSDRTEIKSIDQNQTAEFDEDKAKLTSESGQLESHDAPLPSHEQKEVPAVLQETTLVEGLGLHSKGLKTFQEFLDDSRIPDQSNSEDPVVEKTLYVDTVHKAESPNLRPVSPNTQDSEFASKSLQEHAVKTWRNEQVHAVDSLLPHQDLKKSHTVDGGDAHLLPNAHKFGDCNISPLIAFGENQDLKLDSTNRDNLEMESSEKQLHSGLPAPPPLPKSPSDSWLWRTLPSMTTKSSSLRPYLNAAITFENNSFKAPASDMKWETIVKTTKVQRRHMHYSEESLTTIPEA